MNDFGIIKMKFGNKFWLVLFWEYIGPKLFAVLGNGIQQLSIPQPSTQSFGMA
jgi:hypothetical protein